MPAVRDLIPHEMPDGLVLGDVEFLRKLAVETVDTEPYQRADFGNLEGLSQYSGHDSRINLLELLIGVRGDHEHDRFRRPRIILQVLDHTEAVQTRHHQVEQDDSVFVTLEVLDCLDAVPHTIDFVMLSADDRAEKLSYRLVVVGHQ